VGKIEGRKSWFRESKATCHSEEAKVTIGKVMHEEQPHPLGSGGGARRYDAVLNQENAREDNTGGRTYSSEASGECCSSLGSVGK